MDGWTDGWMDGGRKEGRKGDGGRGRLCGERGRERDGKREGDTNKEREGGGAQEWGIRVSIIGFAWASRLRQSLFSLRC